MPALAIPRRRPFSPGWTATWWRRSKPASRAVCSDTELRWKPGASACVIAASAGYPGSYVTGRRISGLEEAARVPGVEIFHSGTALVDGHYVTEGGRVLGVTAAAANLEQSLSRAYEALGQIHFEGMYYRRDIGRRALKSA